MNDLTQPIHFEHHSTNFNRLKGRLEHHVGRAIADFNMIEEGDSVMVCLSGGKDSYTLLDILLTLRKRAPIDFRIVAMNLDQKQPGFPAEVLPNYLKQLGVEYHIETLFLNMFFGGKLKAMPPKLVTDKGAHIVIRPLTYCSEKDIARYARGMEFPIIPCNLCGAQAVSYTHLRAHETRHDL